MQALINVVQNDVGYELNFTLQDAVGNVVDLTGATLKFKAQLISYFPVKFEGTMSIISAIAGTCKYQVAAPNFDVSGTYDVQIEATFPTRVISWEGIEVLVDPRNPQT